MLGKIGLVKEQTAISRSITEKDVCHDKMCLQTKRDCRFTSCGLAHKSHIKLCLVVADALYDFSASINMYSRTCLHDILFFFFW